MDQGVVRGAEEVMVKNRVLCVLSLAAVVALTGAVPGWAGGRKKPKPETVLILYGATGQYGWVGDVHARMLANLLGHFSLPYRVKPVEDYTRGEIDSALATFYIGNDYYAPVPDHFYSDVMNSTKTICWFKYHIWELDWRDARFPIKFGLAWNRLDWNGYDTIYYQGESFTKHQADPELGVLDIVDPGVCEEIASARLTIGPGQYDWVPYIVHGANLWYVADLPFAYISEEDRYIVFCDLLHDILGIDHEESKRAIIRIEDVDPNADPDELRQIADYLYSEGVPFAVSVVPVYYDPLGFYNNSIPERERMSQVKEFLSALDYMVERGGNIVLHGYTHQYDETANPYNGVTGDDFEFYRVSLDDYGRVVYGGPVPEDSERWARDRVRRGLQELERSGFSPVAWETPHYAASSTDYPVFANTFSATIQRVLYFTDYPLAAHLFARAYGAPGRVKKLGRARAVSASAEPLYFGGQFFPYVIHRDIYGQKVIPENLGNVEPEPWGEYPARLPEDIVRAASKNLVVRDGWASAYFHPFYDISYLEELVSGIKALGYTYVPVTADLQ